MTGAGGQGLGAGERRGASRRSFYLSALALVANKPRAQRASFPRLGRSAQFGQDLSHVAVAQLRNLLPSPGPQPPLPVASGLTVLHLREVQQGNFLC